jgi:hypothetical protein
MSTNPAPLHSRDLPSLCAEHTRRLQLLFHAFYIGNMSMQEYRKRSRELTQNFVNELMLLLTKSDISAIDTTK